MIVADGQLPVVDALDVRIDNLPEVEKGSCVVVSIVGCKGCLAVASDEEVVDDEDAVAVPDVMPTETLLPSVVRTRSDGTAPDKTFEM